MRWTDLRGANLNGTRMDNVTLLGARINIETQQLSGWSADDLHKLKQQGCTYSEQHLSATIEKPGVLLELNTKISSSFCEWLEISLIGKIAFVEQKTDVSIMIKTSESAMTIVEFLMACSKGHAHPLRSKMMRISHPTLNTQAIAILQHGISCTVFLSSENGVVQGQRHLSTNI